MLPLSTHLFPHWSIPLKPTYLTHRDPYKDSQNHRHRVHRGRNEIVVSVSARSAGAYTATLYVMVNIGKGGGRSPPTLASLG
jgi:hypothetical protein